ncbi:hypothetical protein BGX28_000359, partial [Mortierella sp. GBA30]
MGVFGLWRFLTRKGFEAVVIFQQAVPSNTSEPNPRYLIDVLGCIFATILFAYSSLSLDLAHPVVEKALRVFAHPSSALLYLDGCPAEEKMLTHALREKIRIEALSKADECTSRLLDRVTNKLRVRKQHFFTIRKHLKKAFYWPPDARRTLAEYLRSEGWTVIECATEADIKIASDCTPDDIVISSDSDMLLYKNVKTIWRPICKRRFLVYHMPDVLITLGITRTQLTVLGVVSHNDYNRNIYGLGCSTNFSIISDLQGTDAEAMVQRYLQHPRVVLKNKEDFTFKNSIKVFVKGKQSPVQAVTLVHSNTQESTTYEVVMDKFKHTCEQQAINNKQREEERQAAKT